MENPVESMPSSNYAQSIDDVLFDSNYDQNRTISANGFIVASDLHGNYNSLEQVYSIAKDRNLGVVINGDIVNDYHFKEFANNLGFKSQQDMFLEYAQNNLTQEDLHTLLFSQQYSQVQSLEPFLNQVPDFQKSQVKEQLEGILSYSQSNEFKEKFEQTAYNFKEEKEDEVIQNQIHLNVLYHVFMEEEAKRLAGEINKYDVSTLFNLGNHEHSLFAKQVRGYLDDPSKLIDVTNHKGHVRIEQENGQEINLAGMTNCAQIMPYLQEVVFSEQEYQLLTHHMNIDDIKSQTLLKGSVSYDELSSLEGLIKQDSDYKRIVQEKEKPLDVFLTHGQIGEVKMNSGKGMDVPYLATAAYFSDLADLTIEGHIHSKYDGKNSFGNNMIRAAGEDAAIIRKDDEGGLQKEWVRVDDSFNGNHDNEIPYSPDEMYQKVKEKIALLQQQGDTIAANDDISEEEKLSA